MATSATITRPAQADRGTVVTARADGVAVRLGVGRGADFCGAADQRVDQRPGRDLYHLQVPWDGFARCCPTSITRTLPVAAEACGRQCLLRPK